MHFPEVRPGWMLLCEINNEAAIAKDVTVITFDGTNYSVTASCPLNAFTDAKIVVPRLDQAYRIADIILETNHGTN